MRRDRIVRDRMAHGDAHAVVDENWTAVGRDNGEQCVHERLPHGEGGVLGWKDPTAVWGVLDRMPRGNAQVALGGGSNGHFQHLRTPRLDHAFDGRDSLRIVWIHANAIALAQLLDVDG